LGENGRPFTLGRTMSDILLDPIEARILGVLAEKQATTPDVYPLTVNALLSGCNQKTSRDPVLNLTESEVQAALEELRHRTLVVESYGASGRVLRYAQNLDRVLKLPPASHAILAVLMLRGPQTPGELRSNCDRLYHFPDISALEGYLDELAERPSGPLVLKLAKQPGSREHRYAHLLCGEVAFAAASASPEPEEPRATGHAGELARLRAEVTELRRLVDHLYAELGVAEPPASSA